MSAALAQGMNGPSRRELILWSASLAAVLAGHLVAALLLLHRPAPLEPPKPPPAAYLDLPPLPSAGYGGAPGPSQPAKPAVTQPLPPKPPAQAVKPVQPTEPPKPPVQEVKPPPQPVTPPKFAVPLPVESKPRPPAPKAVPPKAAAEPPPSLTGSAPILRLSAVGLWQAGVIERITKFKQWPSQAVRYRLTGTAGLRLEVDRQGNILSYSLASSSGYELLDRATLDMARRAQRLPALPSEIPGETHQFTLTVEWY
jgi:protein TonB